MVPRRPRLENDALGVLFAALAALVFSTMAILGKLAYREGAEALPLLVVRFGVAALLLFIARGVRGKEGRRDGPRLRLMLLGAVGYGFESLLFFTAVERAPASVVGLVFYSYPMWTAALAFATRIEPFRWRLLIALILGTVGVAMVFATPLEGVAGPLLALSAAVAVAIYLIVTQVLVRDTAPVSAATWTAMGAAAGLLGAWIVAGGRLPASALPYGAALGLVTFTAFLLLYASIARIGSARSSVALMLEPVATVVLAAVVLDEEITAQILAGTALIVAALPIVALPTRADVHPPDAL